MEGDKIVETPSIRPLPRGSHVLEDQPPVVEIRMADGIFIKQIYVAKANSIMPQHSHHYDHVSMLACGSVDVWADEVFLGSYAAPTGIHIKAGVKHLFFTKEDGTLIYCIHNISRGEEAAVESEHVFVLEPQTRENR